MVAKLGGSSTIRSKRSPRRARSEEHTSELQSRPQLVCRLLLEKKKCHSSSGILWNLRPGRNSMEMYPNETPPPGIYTLSLHDALPISGTTAAAPRRRRRRSPRRRGRCACPWWRSSAGRARSGRSARRGARDRKSTRLNSSHVRSSYAVFCLKKKSATAPRGFCGTSGQGETQWRCIRTKPPPPGSTPFPYTTLFRSRGQQPQRRGGDVGVVRGDAEGALAHGGEARRVEHDQVEALAAAREIGRAHV